MLCAALCCAARSGIPLGFLETACGPAVGQRGSRGTLQSLAWDLWAVPARLLRAASPRALCCAWGERAAAGGGCRECVSVPLERLALSHIATGSFKCD